METTPIREILRNSKMPYTWGLLESAPRGTHGPRVASKPIPGAPPSLEIPPPGCRFHPRCPYTVNECRTTHPRMHDVVGDHRARCHFAEQPDWRPREVEFASLDGLARSANTVLELRGVTKIFGAGSNVFTAVDNVDLSVARGEILAVVGESGSGKTTLGKLIVQLLLPTAGTIAISGQPIDRSDAGAVKAYRRRVQMVFQDPFSSLNPRMRILDAVTEPRLMLGDSRTDARRRAAELLERCGIAGPLHALYPHQFSGGQRQRVGIARALVLKPEVVVLDEPVSALDVSIQAQILALLREMRQAMDTSFIFISHDLSVVRELSDRTAVMYRGRIVELADTMTLFERPQHDYTRTLLAAIPSIEAA